MNPHAAGQSVSISKPSNASDRFIVNHFTKLLANCILNNHHVFIGASYTLSYALNRYFDQICKFYQDKRGCVVENIFKVKCQHCILVLT